MPGFQLSQPDSYCIFMRIQMLVGSHFLDSRPNGEYSFGGNLLESYLAYEAVEAHTAICLA